VVLGWVLVAVFEWVHCARDLTTAAARRPGGTAEGDVAAAPSARAVFGGLSGRGGASDAPTWIASPAMLADWPVADLEPGCRVSGRGADARARRARDRARCRPGRTGEEAVPNEPEQEDDDHDAELDEAEPKAPERTPERARGRSPQRAARSSDAPRATASIRSPLHLRKANVSARRVRSRRETPTSSTARRRGVFASDAGQRRGLATWRSGGGRGRDSSSGQRGTLRLRVLPRFPRRSLSSRTPRSPTSRSPPRRRRCRTRRPHGAGSCDRLPGRPEAAVERHRSLERLVARACRTRSTPSPRSSGSSSSRCREFADLPASFRQTSTPLVRESFGDLLRRLRLGLAQRQAALAGVALLAAVVSLAVTTRRPHSRRVLPRRSARTPPSPARAA